MEPDFRYSLEARFRAPFRRNVIVMTIIFVLLYAIIITATNYREEGWIWFSPEREERWFLLIFDILLSLALLRIYFRMYNRFVQMNRHYLQDAAFGFIIKEQMSITRVFDTPSGINIYWLSSDDIKTFVPDPYRIFRKGDQVFIYYLKYSKEYLAYEL